MKKKTTRIDLEMAAQARAHHSYLGELLDRAKVALLRGETDEALKCIKLARRAYIGSTFGSNDQILVAAREFRQSEAFNVGYEDVRL